MMLRRRPGAAGAFVGAVEEKEAEIEEDTPLVTSSDQSDTLLKPDANNKGGLRLRKANDTENTTTNTSTDNESTATSGGAA